MPPRWKVASAGAMAAAATAHGYLGLRDTIRELSLLERAAGAHDSFLGSESLAEPLFDPIRPSSRFVGPVTPVGLDQRLVGG